MRLFVLKVGGVPGAKLQGASLHPGEAGLQQLLWLGQPEQHCGLHAENPLQLKTDKPQRCNMETVSQTHFLQINCKIEKKKKQSQVSFWRGAGLRKLIAFIWVEQLHLSIKGDSLPDAPFYNWQRQKVEVSPSPQQDLLLTEYLHPSKSRLLEFVLYSR